MLLSSLLELYILMYATPLNSQQVTQLPWREALRFAWMPRKFRLRETRCLLKTNTKWWQWSRISRKPFCELPLNWTWKRKLTLTVTFPFKMTPSYNDSWTKGTVNFTWGERSLKISFIVMSRRVWNWSGPLKQLSYPQYSAVNTLAVTSGRDHGKFETFVTIPKYSARPNIMQISDTKYTFLNISALMQLMQT